MIRDLVDSRGGSVTGAFAMSALLLALAGCSTGQMTPQRRGEIVDTLQRQAAAWNAGDIEAFMETYWRSPELTFSSSGKVRRGWDETLARFQKSYPTRDEMGKLTFSDFEVTALGPQTALVLGLWNLERDDPIGGAFSLVLRRDAAGWVIIHDHTSSLEP